jgi:hypothetical protein
VAVSPGARILWIDASGRALGSWPGQEPPSTVEVIVAVEDEPGERFLAGCVQALGAAGVDALCRVEPVVDALVDLDPTGRVVGYLDRDRHVRSAFPQVVAAGWWPRLAAAVEARRAAGSPVDLAGLVASLGGRVAPLEDSMIEAH